MEPESPSQEDKDESRRLRLSPIQGERGRKWDLWMEDTLLVLLDPDDRAVVHLHREEAARYLRFGVNLFWSRTITLVIIEGIKSYTFRCGRTDMARLLDWLPGKPPARKAKEVRQSGLLTLLAGVLHLALPDHLAWQLGVPLLAVGLLGIARPRRGMYPVNGVIMAGVGFIHLFAPTLQTLVATIPIADTGMVPLAVGSVLLLWGVQQLSMLGANQQLRAAREARDQQADFLPPKSAVVRGIGLCNLYAATLFAGYALTVFALFPMVTQRSPESAGGPLTHPDVVGFSVFALLNGSAASVLLFRRSPAYFEAKVSAQMMALTLVCAFWGVAANVELSDPGAVFGNVLTGYDQTLIQLRVWLSLVVCVGLFNRWFTGAVDRELEEGRH